MSETPVILYLAAQLPKRSETFVSSEILALRALGRRVLVASVHPPERSLGSPLLEALADEAIPVYGLGVARNLSLAVAEGLGHPLNTFHNGWKIVRDLFGTSERKGATSLKVAWQWIAGIALARRLRAKKVTHIHAHMAHVPSTIALVAARQLHIPFSFTGHAADLFRDRSLLEAKLKSAVFVACISHWHRGFFSKIASNSSTHYPLIRCGVDTSLFTASKRPSSKQRILAIGRLVPKKGFDLLLNACAVLRRKGYPIDAVIGGDGPEYEHLLSLRSKLGLEKEVVFPGALSHAQVRTELSEAAVFALPCRVDPKGDQDGIPVALMEAMSAGVPCISGDLPPIRELILHNQTGLLVPPGNIEALQLALEKLLLDEPLRLKLAANARELIETEFSAATNIPRLLTQFDRSFAI